MVHLRIVVPSDSSSQVRHLLEETPSVCNLIFLEGAAQKPDGDVILCDVAREDASVIVSDLRELEVDQHGSIAMEDIDSQISAVAREAEKAATGMPSDAVVWEEVESRTSENIELSASFLAFMTLAMLIAACGILTDQLILIIGAMVVGPEFGPIAALSVAAVERRGELAKRSLTALGVGLVVGVVATFVFTLALEAAGQVPASFDQESNQFTAFISSPDFFSFLVAFIAGVAGVLSLTNAKSGALVGVLISVTTLPAAANIAVAGALGDWEPAAGALAQLALNLGAICLACMGTLLFQRRLYMRRRREHLQDKSRTAGGLPIGHSRREGSASYKPPPNVG